MTPTRAAVLAAVLAVAASLPAAPRLLALDDPESAGPDMRLLATPQELLFRVDLGKAGRRFQPQALEGAMGWSVPLAQGSTTLDVAWPTPATDGERVFVGGPLSYAEFYALDAESGRLSWKAGLSDNGPTPPVVRDRRVYFNTQSCTLYAYDTRSGTRLWSRYLAGHLESIPALAGETLVTTRPERHERRNGGGPALTLLDLRGRITKNVDIDSEAIGAPVLHGGNAYVATRGGLLYCVDLAQGEQRWSRACQARGAPWVDDTGIYVATGGEVQAFHPETGRPRWDHVAITPSSGTRELPTTVQPPPLRKEIADRNRGDAFWGEGMRPVLLGDELCIAEGRTLRFFHRITGAEIAWWELDVDDDIVGAPIVAGETVVVATRTGQVRAVDVRHGEVAWAVDVGAVLGSGIVVDDGKLYAVTRDGRLVCVHTGDLRADGWPMWGGTAGHAAGDRGAQRPEDSSSSRNVR